jgi:DNA-binding response OmpR family regulator
MQPKKILLVEDERITLALMRKFLVEKGYDVLTSQDGESAVSMALEQRPDLILLDLGLDDGANPFEGPHFDGFSVMEWMRRMSKVLQVPVIVVTGREGANLKQRVLDAGAVAFFHKPIDKQKVLTAIQIALDTA